MPNRFLSYPLQVISHHTIRRYIVWTVWTLSHKRTTPYEIQGGWNGTGVGLPMLIIILQLFHTHISLPPEVCDSPYQAAHYHNLGLWVWGILLWQGTWAPDTEWDSFPMLHGNWPSCRPEPLRTGIMCIDFLLVHFILKLKKKQKWKRFELYIYSMFKALSMRTARLFLRGRKGDRIFALKHMLKPFNTIFIYHRRIFELGQLSRYSDGVDGRGKRFFSISQRPDRLWGPPSLVSNG
jgi:hypothetical protein